MRQRSPLACNAWARALAICGLVAGAVAAADATQTRMTAGVFKTADDF